MLLDFKTYYKATVIKRVWYWHQKQTHRSTEQEKKKKKKGWEVSPRIDEQMIFNKDAKASLGKGRVFSKWLRKLISICKRMKLDPYLIP